jgi:hypothetical protein
LQVVGAAYRRAATVEASIHSFIKTGLFPCNRYINLDHGLACHGMDESQDKRVNGAGSETSRLGTSNDSFENASAGKFIRSKDVRPSQLAAKCSAPTGQAKQSGASSAMLLTASLYRK